MPSGSSFILGQINVGAVRSISELIPVFFLMVGILPKSVTSLGVNVGLLDPGVFIHRMILVGWFLLGFGPAYLLFDASV